VRANLLAAAPLADAIEAWVRSQSFGRYEPTGVKELARRAGVHERTVQRIRGHRFVQVGVADRLALAMGLHIAVIWPSQEVA
jgi:lambda repressor-like predicted transcriptional regulator